MAINFYEDALPALTAVAEFEPDGPFAWFRLFDFLTDTCGHAEGKAIQVAELLAGDGFVSIDNESATFAAGSHVSRAQITPKGLKLLDLWPTEDNELKYIVAQIADALEDLADDASTDEESTKLRAAASYVKGFTEAVAANILAGGIAG